MEYVIIGLCGTEKVKVFTDRANFDNKCSRIIELLKYEGQEHFRSRIRIWIKESREVAKQRNVVIHTPMTAMQSMVDIRVRYYMEMAEGSSEITTQHLVECSKKIEALCAEGTNLLQIIAKSKKSADGTVIRPALEEIFPPLDEDDE
jgi:hypothetical protein